MHLLPRTTFLLWMDVWMKYCRGIISCLPVDVRVSRSRETVEMIPSVYRSPRSTSALLKRKKKSVSWKSQLNRQSQEIPEDFKSPRKENGMGINRSEKWSKQKLFTPPHFYLWEITKHSWYCFLPIVPPHAVHSSWDAGFYCFHSAASQNAACLCDAWWSHHCSLEIAEAIKAKSKASEKGRGGEILIFWAPCLLVSVWKLLLGLDDIWGSLDMKRGLQSFVTVCGWALSGVDGGEVSEKNWWENTKLPSGSKRQCRAKRSDSNIQLPQVKSTCLLAYSKLSWVTLSMSFHFSVPQFYQL